MKQDEGSRLVTRVITCYRQWDFVRHWLPDDSLFQPHVSWILVNDDPADPPPEDVRQLLNARGIQLLTPLFNQGVSGARNFGLGSVRTSWVEFVDGDDWPLPLAEAPLREHAGTALLIYEFVLHTLNDGRREPVKEWPFNEANTDDVRFVFAHDSRIQCRAAVSIWNREALISLGGFDPRFDGVEDLHLAWKIERTGFAYDFVPEAKQSYYWCNPAQSAVEWRKQSQLRLYLLLKQHSTPEKFEAFDRLLVKYSSSMVDVGMAVLENLTREQGRNPSIAPRLVGAVRAIFWQSRRLLGATLGGMPLVFRVKESVKTLIGRL